MNYVLKRKDEIITIVDFADDGSVYKFHHKLVNPELAPLHDTNNLDWLKQWWKRRSIPISQGNIRHMLEEKGLLGPEDFLLKNLGLSLTDYYWISPLDSGITWKDVNLFENDFHGNIMIGEAESENFDDMPHYTPNGSLQGTLEKSWTILNGERGLLKGNCNNLSSESINEVIASKLHEMQGFKNYTKYKLIKINGRNYDYGCYSKLFTSQELELISAYDVVCSEKKPNDISVFEHFIHVCAKNGLDENILRNFLDYMILSDFVLSGRDRHLSNVSILRDSGSLQFAMPAPIYDSGKCLFVQDIVPSSDKGLLSIKTESFASDELKLLSLVKDRSLLDVTKLPARSFIEEIYGLDSQIDEKRIALIGEGYERKIEMFRAFQLGQDLHKIKMAVKNYCKATIDTDDFIIKSDAT
ncbi:MAG: hypothetical protein IJN92_08905 [Lachnospiraceae bacterium]|nr:hypothetical protein [Lachnospiraceae bacterium]